MNLAALAFASAVLAADTSAPAQTLQKTVLVELFTSQGCSSCPPAEEILADIAARDTADGQLVTLAFHVDYWDRLGWKDPFSSAAFSTRQWQYANALRLQSVYTPQVIVDGVYEMVGSDRRKIAAAIKRRHSTPARIALDVTVTRSEDRGNRERASVRASVLALEPSSDPKWLHAAAFLPEATTHVRSGENAGETIRQVNIVRTLAEPKPFRLTRGKFDADFTLTLLPNERIAVWVQDYRTSAVEQAAVR